jgi:hypothetical protein
LSSSPGGSVTVVVVLAMVVVAEHGQFRFAGAPTAAFRQRRASVAFGGRVPVGAQTHSGVQVTLPTAAWRMKRQSDATGDDPALIG